VVKTVEDLRTGRAASKTLQHDSPTLLGALQALKQEAANIRAGMYEPLANEGDEDETA
jgi:hypothetical protein